MADQPMKHSIHLVTKETSLTTWCELSAVGVRRTTSRHTATCTMCLVSSAARANDAIQPLVQAYDTRFPVRYSAFRKWFAQEFAGTDVVDAALAEMASDKLKAGTHCPGCKATLDDPIVLYIPDANQMQFACPNCTTDVILLERWKAEAST